MTTSKKVESTAIERNVDRLIVLCSDSDPVVRKNSSECLAAGSHSMNARQLGEIKDLINGGSDHKGLLVFSLVNCKDRELALESLEGMIRGNVTEVANSAARALSYLRVRFGMKTTDIALSVAQDLNTSVSDAYSLFRCIDNYGIEKACEDVSATFIGSGTPSARLTLQVGLLNLFSSHIGDSVLVDLRPSADNLLSQGHAVCRAIADREYASVYWCRYLMDYFNRTVEPNQRRMYLLALQKLESVDIPTGELLSRLYHQPDDDNWVFVVRAMDKHFLPVRKNYHGR